MNGFTRAARVALTLAIPMLIASQPASAAGPTSPPESTVELRVVNTHRSSVRLYLRTADGLVRSLGRVGGEGERTLDLPAPAAEGPFVLEVYLDVPEWAPNGRSGLRSGELMVPPGEALLLKLGSHLALSTLELATD